ncbi:MAG: DegT/DnrJ/EryC1/StrS family aminotransferase [Geminicoccaceae bacterium]
MKRWPEFDDEEIAAVESVLRSGRINYWTGEEGRNFEQAYAKACNRAYGVALANGTVALELALKVLDIGPGDEVIVTPRSFIASASSALICGAKPVFADVNPVSQNITAEAIAPVITPRTKAIIAVHLGGWPCDMDAICDLARRHGIFVIEDCAQAHGATYRGQPVGSFGDVATFSFCQDKIITTGGEGGMLILDDQSLWERAWSYKDHGKSYDAVYNREHAPGFRWLHETAGTNWRMTEMQAAIGRIQLGRLPEWISKRRALAARLQACCEALTVLRTTPPPAEIGHAYYRYYTFVRTDQLARGWSRDRIMNDITAAGVPCFSGSCSEIYREKVFTDLGLQTEALPVAAELGQTSLAFLVHPTLDDADMDTVCDAISSVCATAASSVAA